MSDLHQRSPASDGSSSGKKQQNVPPNLRPLAPKPPPPPPPSTQALAVRTASPQIPGSSLGASKHRSPAPCAVCYRIGCQLPTHTAFASISHSSSSNSPEKTTSSSSVFQQDPVFTSSYAYKLIQQQHEGGNTTASTANSSYNLPLDEELNTPEIHYLFHSLFAVDAQNSFNIPRPQEIIGDLLWGPFLLPATQDSLLCLSIVAASAAGLTDYLDQQPRNVTTLTILGQAIQQMRERINSDPSHIADTTIIAAVFLWVANIFLHDTEAMTSHRGSIFAFVETRGGLHKLGMVGAVAHVIRWVDAIHTFILPVPCQYLDPPDPGPPSNPPPPCYGAYWDEPTQSANMNIATKVVKACQDTCRLLEYLEYVEDSGLSAAEFVKLTQRLCVLYTNGSLLRARSYEHARVNECVVVAISLIQFRCFGGMSKLRAMATTNISRLAAALKAAGGPSFWQKDLDLLIWLLFVVVIFPAEQGENSWCLPFLCRVVVSRFGNQGSLKSSWKQEVRARLHRFVWCDIRLEQPFKEACQAIRKELEHEESDDESTDEDE